jgi:hypothetical protein
MAPRLASQNRPTFSITASTSFPTGWAGLQSRSQCDQVRATIRRAIHAGEIRVRPDPRNPDKVVITPIAV